MSPVEKPAKTEKAPARVTKETWEAQFAKKFTDLVQQLTEWRDGKLAIALPKVKELKKALADMRKVKPKEIRAGGAYEREGLVYCSLTKEQKIAIQGHAEANDTSVAAVIKPWIMSGARKAGLAGFSE